MAAHLYRDAGEAVNILGFGKGFTFYQVAEDVPATLACI